MAESVFILGGQVELPLFPTDLAGDVARGVTAGITGTGDTTIIPSPGAGYRLLVYKTKGSNGHQSVSTLVELKNGTAVLDRCWAQAGGGGWSDAFPLNAPLVLDPDTPFQAACTTPGALVYVSAVAVRVAVG